MTTENSRKGDRRVQSNSWLAKLMTVENLITWTGLVVTGAIAYTNVVARVSAVEQADKAQIQQIDEIENKLDTTKSTVIRLEANVGSIKEDVGWIRNKLDK